MTSKLGGTEAEVLTTIATRRTDPRSPAFLSNDDVVLTATAAVITVRTN
jgi:hypothetical protein